jgi:5-methylcytosine-specific restriction enzyme A
VEKLLVSRPTSQKYADALKVLKLTKGQQKLLKFHGRYQSRHNASATCPKLAKAADYKNHGGVNAAYGGLGKRIAQHLGCDVPENPATFIVDWISPKNGDGFRCKLHPEIFEALGILGCLSSEKDTMKIFPDEVDESEVLREGTVYKVSVNAYERNPQARQKCIDYYGAHCDACKFDFSEHYGELGEGFIHVHHLRPISEIGDEYEIDPVKDLRPVCPNCHAMIHRRSPPYSIEEIRMILNDCKKK